MSIAVLLVLAIAAFLAGLGGSYLGVGGGVFLIPFMTLALSVNIKVAIATSMIGVTAAASAFIYYSQGLVDPGLAAMVIIGVFSGTNLGTRLLEHAKSSNVRFAFALFLVVLGTGMVARLFLPGVPI